MLATGHVDHKIVNYVNGCYMPLFEVTGRYVGEVLLKVRAPTREMAIRALDDGGEDELIVLNPSQVVFNEDHVKETEA